MTKCPSLSPNGQPKSKADSPDPATFDHDVSKSTMNQIFSPAETQSSRSSDEAPVKQPAAIHDLKRRLSEISQGSLKSLHQTKKVKSSSHSPTTPPTQGNPSEPKVKTHVFGFRSCLLTSFDALIPKPDGMTMFEFCVRRYFEAVWAGQLDNQSLCSDEVRKFFQTFPSEDLAVDLILYSCPKLQEKINSCPPRITREDMQYFGFRLDNWSEDMNGGAYNGMNDYSDGSLPTNYHGSTSIFAYRVAKQHMNSAYRAVHPRTPMYAEMKKATRTTWSTHVQCPPAYCFQDDWSPLRIKLLESCVMALLQLYSSAHFTRVKREISLATLWSQENVACRADFEALEQKRGFKSLNVSIPYAEDTDTAFDRAKHLFEGTIVPIVYDSIYGASPKFIVQYAATRNYSFWFTPQQYEILLEGDVKYGQCRIEKTVDGSPHPHQWADIDPDYNESRYGNAITMGISFTFLAKHSHSPTTFWINSTKTKGFFSTVEARALWLLSIHEYVFGYEGDAGPDRFPFLGRPSTGESKFYNTSLDIARAKWIKEYIDACRKGKYPCPFCTQLFEASPEDIEDCEAKSSNFRDHFGKYSVPCKKNLLKALGMDDAAIAEHIILCHCTLEFACGWKQYAHFERLAGRDCLEKENEIRTSHGLQPVVVAAKCPTCQKDWGPRQHKLHHLANPECLRVWNEKQIAERLPTWMPFKCWCDELFSHESAWCKHLCKQKNDACFQQENTRRSQDPTLKPIRLTNYCQEKPCNKKFVSIKNKDSKQRQNRVEVVPGYRFGARSIMEVREHYTLCHPGVQCPDKCKYTKVLQPVGQKTQKPRRGWRALKKKVTSGKENDEEENDEKENDEKENDENEDDENESSGIA